MVLACVDRMRANTEDSIVYEHKRNINTNQKDTEHETGDKAADENHSLDNRTAEAQCNTPPVVNSCAGRELSVQVYTDNVTAYSSSTRPSLVSPMISSSSMGVSAGIVVSRGPVSTSMA